MVNLDSAAKSPNALRTIGEVAQQLGVATHVLRFWEGKFPEIKPQKRRGRRYYSPEDVNLIIKIKTLLYYQGYTIKGVRKCLGRSDFDKINFSTDPNSQVQQTVQNGQSSTAKQSQVKEKQHSPSSPENSSDNSKELATQQLLQIKQNLNKIRVELDQVA